MEGLEKVSHGRYELSERQWELVRVELPQPVVRADGKGRPSRSDKEILNGIFWFVDATINKAHKSAAGAKKKKPQTRP